MSRRVGTSSRHNRHGPQGQIVNHNPFHEAILGSPDVMIREGDAMLLIPCVQRDLQTASPVAWAEAVARRRT